MGKDWSLDLNFESKHSRNDVYTISILSLSLISFSLLLSSRRLLHVVFAIQKWSLLFSLNLYCCTYVILSLTCNMYSDICLYNSNTYVLVFFLKKKLLCTTVVEFSDWPSSNLLMEFFRKILAPHHSFGLVCNLFHPSLKKKGKSWMSKFVVLWGVTSIKGLSHLSKVSLFLGQRE